MADVNQVGNYVVSHNAQRVDLCVECPEQTINITDNEDHSTIYDVTNYGNNSKKIINIFDKSASKDTQGNDINDTLKVDLWEGESYTAYRSKSGDVSVSIFNSDHTLKTQITCTGVETFQYIDDYVTHMMQINPSDTLKIQNNK